MRADRFDGIAAARGRPCVDLEPPSSDNPNDQILTRGFSWPSLCTATVAKARLRRRSAPRAPDLNEAHDK